MSQLYTLFYGKSKKRMYPIMIDTLTKCENYRDAREHTVRGWHDIRVADSEATTWRQKTATRGGNKCESVARVNRPTPGWIGKNGFRPHT